MSNSERLLVGPRPLPPRTIPSQSAQQKQPTQSLHLPSTPSPSPSPSPLPAERTTRRWHSTAARKPVLDPVMEGDGKLLREVHSPPPGDVRVPRRISNPELGRQRSQYYDKVLTAKNYNNSLDDPVRANCMVLCELKTNVTIRDELTFIKDLSYHLAARYQRSPSSIVVVVEKASMYFAESFEPAYSVAIHALASQAGQTVTNKRNICLLQKHLAHRLGIAPERGLVRYVGVPEECYGWGGNTVAGEVASNHMRAQRERSKDTDETERRGPVRSLSHKLGADRSNKVRFGKAAVAPLRVMTRAPLPSESAPTSDNAAVPAMRIDVEPSKVPLSRRTSFLQGLFKRSSRPDFDTNGTTEAP